MKTLVIHPKDRSTEFLKPIYEKIVNKTVVDGGLSYKEVNDLIKEHDRVIMLGHGCPYGLFSVGVFKTKYGLIIDFDSVEELSKKKDNVYIWCNANQFVDNNGLKGFYSGMFVSEIYEGEYEGLGTVTQNVIDESNNTFSSILGEHINNPTDVIHRNVTLMYEQVSYKNVVAKYNNERLYMMV